MAKNLGRLAKKTDAEQAFQTRQIDEREDVIGHFSFYEPQHPYLIEVKGTQLGSAEQIARLYSDLYPCFLQISTEKSIHLYQVSNGIPHMWDNELPIPIKPLSRAHGAGRAAVQDSLFEDKEDIVTNISATFESVHNVMRSRDGRQPPEALDELLSILFVLIEIQRRGEGDLSRRYVTTNRNGVELESETGHAQRIRWAQLCALKRYHDSGNGIHGINVSSLSDTTLSRVVTELVEHDYVACPIDIKSAALRAFLSTTLRKGLGIYLTPDCVVDATIRAVQPEGGSRVLDPACGTGSFLLHTVFQWREAEKAGEARAEVWGVDLNPRVLRAAEVNLVPLVGSRFHHWNGDALSSFGAAERPDWFESDSFDYIFTNPPFGVSIKHDDLIKFGFGTARDENGKIKTRIGSDIVFIERCIDFLRPGGLLAIVLPNSALNNKSYDFARKFIDTKARLVAVWQLPTETFMITGTQTTTSVLFFQKHGARDGLSPPSGSLFFASIENVGYDQTGRARAGNQMPDAADELRSFLRDGNTEGFKIGRIRQVEQSRTFELFSSNNTGGVTRKNSSRKIKEVANVIRIGKTPPRSEYTEEGHFIIKVGNLTGMGIDWMSRDRNFVSKAYIEKLKKSRVGDGLIIQRGDILLTSSAHAVRYIASKVDIVDEIPDFIRHPCTYVGELLLIRPDPKKIDPFVLLAFLRSEGAQAALQGMIRGQTAHLMPDDAKELAIPDDAADPEAIEIIRGLLVEECKASLAASLRRTRLASMIESQFDAA